MNNEPLSPRMQELAQQISAEVALIRSLLQDAYVHSVKTGNLLIEASTLVPRPADDNWLEAPFGLSWAEVDTFMHIAKNATLRNDVHVRARWLSMEEVEEWNAEIGSVVETAYYDDLYLNPSLDAHLKEQNDMCRAVLDRGFVAPAELAALECILSKLRIRIITQLFKRLS